MLRLASRTALGSAAALLLATVPLVAQNPPPPPPPPSVAVTGVGYLQYLYQVKDTANHGNNFDVTRAYVNVLGRFSDGLATRITADVYHNAADGSLSYRLKYAFAAYTPRGSDLTYKLGLIHTAWLDWEEALWDYRMQGTMPIERNGKQSSAALGVGIDGHWSSEMVNAQVTAINNTNYNQALGDQRKKVQARASFRLAKSDDAGRVGGVRITGFAEYGKPLTGGTEYRLVGMASYKSKMLTLAGQYIATQDSTAGAAMVKAQIISGYGVLHFTGSQAALLARVDYTKPNTDSAIPSTTPGYTNTRIIGGLSYQLTPNLRLLGDVDWLTYANGSPTPAAEAARALALFQAQFTF